MISWRIVGKIATMWIPERFVLDEESTLEMLHQMGAADLITPTAEGLQVTFLPMVFDETAGEHGVLRTHLARQNPHWMAARDSDAESLVIVHGADSYISPNWYASKAENPRTVPTWNYVVLHLHGRVVVHDDPEWVRRQVASQTAKYEEPFAEPWQVADAPEDYIAGMCRAIVGIEFQISRIEAKSKQSQNRSAADVRSAIAGLRAVGDLDGAAALSEANRHRLTTL